MAGWTEDDRSVLVYDKYDLWQLDPSGAGATRLTNGADDGIQYRYVRLDADEDVISSSAPIYLSMYGEWSKHYGYARLRLGGSPERLVWLDANVSRLTKAEDADVYGYVLQDFDDSPDFFVGDETLSDAEQVTATNPFQEDYAWGHS